MSSQPGGGDRPPTASGRPLAESYTPAEWRTLTRLPSQVVVAAVDSSSGAGGKDQVSEVVAGLDGIASGRSFDSDLVREVAAAVYAEHDHGSAEAPDDSPDVLLSCREVAHLLASRADPADAAAYRQWIQSIAARAGRSLRDHERDRQWFLAELGRALGLS